MTSSDSVLTANLITGRTVEQGVAIEGWKDKQEYVDAAGFVHIDPSDFKTLNVWPGSNVSVKSDYGEVVVKALKSPYGPHPGIVFIPMGPWANQVVNPDTDTTGMPSYKGIMVTITPAPGAKVLGAIALIKTTTQGGVEA
ncbi:MAG: molybdopterin dinucleotide binding domain-containing protein [Halobacteriota archaeon]